MMKTKFKTPAGYVAPLRSRKDILAYLSNSPVTDRRHYDGRTYLYCFNVKVYHTDLSFDHLLSLAVKAGEVSRETAADSVWLENAHQEYADTGEQTLWDWAIENCQRSVLEDDTHKMLWDGDKTLGVEWEFGGRSSGWLCLAKFEGMKLSYPEDLQDLDFPTLNRLYHFIVQCGHDFRSEAIQAEVEWQAALDLFCNVCADCETRAQRNERLASEDQSGEVDSAIEFAEIHA